MWKYSLHAYPIKHSKSKTQVRLTLIIWSPRQALCPTFVFALFSFAGHPHLATDPSSILKSHNIHYLPNTQKKPLFSPAVIYFSWWKKNKGNFSSQHWFLNYVWHTGRLLPDTIWKRNRTPCYSHIAQIGMNF